MNSRRSFIQIIGEILMLEEAVKTEIMYNVNMSYAQAEKYLCFLLRHGFLEKLPSRRGNGLYRRTAKGTRLLKSIENLSHLLGWEEIALECGEEAEKLRV